MPIYNIQVLLLTNKPRHLVTTMPMVAFSNGDAIAMAMS